MLIPYLAKQHAPGNNKLVRTEVYERVMYPPTCRSDDFFFTLYARRAGLRFCHEPEAVIKVEMPSTFKDVLAWESFRVRGLVEGSLMTSSGIPPTLPAWVAYAVSPALLALSVAGILSQNVFVGIPSAIFLGLYALALAYVGFRLRKVSANGYERPSPFQAVMGLVGMYIHAVLTTYYYVKYYLSLRGLREALRRRLEDVLSRFGFERRKYFPE
ncbi:MAG: hypothetical protein J7L55_03305 [Desulfurococcales archaeon]|nr:hypothetical protein [Desulfurococcales archaeon]